MNTKLKLGGQRNRCPTCLDHFNSNFAFDKHRTGPYGEEGRPSNRRCLKPQELLAKGWVRNPAGFWVTSTQPQIDRDPAP